MKLIFAVLFIVFTNWVSAQHKLTLVLDSVPASNAKDSIYMAGSMNGWQPKDFRYLFRDRQLVLALPSGEIQFKLTRGGWQKVETTIDGRPVENRVLNIKSDSVVHVTIKNWQDMFEKIKPVSTASRQVYIIDTGFYMPQLKRHRRIWIYLPKDYKTNQQQHYPVLYMQDGQNLFDATTAFAGEWGVDEFLDSTKLPPCIVVGIDNGGRQRMTEYNAYDHAEFGKGEGREYVRFLAETLKPYIDANFRTLKDAGNTMIAGSSMGGLLSMIAIMENPKVFGVAGVFSPAFWVAGNGFMKDLKTKAKKIKGRIYLYGGGKEGEQMVPDMLQVESILKKYSKATVKTKVKKTGRHNEAEWQTQFPIFYRWVMKQ